MKDITISLRVDDENRICSMDIVEGTYGRTEYVMEDVDEPISVEDAIYEIREYLE